MLRLIADENFNNDILRALDRAVAELDLVRVQDVGLLGADDEVVLSWAAQENRILLTHDVSTMTEFAYERVRAGLPMPGVIEVPETMPVGIALQDLILIFECSRDNEWDSQVLYLPF
jgi:hypothetical protein